VSKAAFIWTDDRVGTLRAMWSRGQSSGRIADALGGGVTRNAVMGKLNRLGLMGAVRTAPPSEAAAARRVRAVAPQGPVPAPPRSLPSVPAVAAPPAVAAAPRNLRDLVAFALGGPAPAPAALAAATAKPAAPARPVRAQRTRAARVAKPPVPAPVQPLPELRGGEAAEVAPAPTLRLVPPPVAVEPRVAHAEPEGREPEAAVHDVSDAPGLGRFSWEAPRADGRPTLLHLKAESCRWPIGDPSKPDFHYCGDGAKGTLPYCSAHCAMAYQVPDRTRPKVVWSPMRIAKARQTAMERMRKQRPKGYARG
jgi:GcrA cell cycle regulator